MIERDTCMDRERDQRYRERETERDGKQETDDVRDIQIATDRKTDRQRPERQRQMETGRKPQEKQKQMPVGW